MKVICKHCEHIFETELTPECHCPACGEKVSSVKGSIELHERRVEKLRENLRGFTLALYGEKTHGGKKLSGSNINGVLLDNLTIPEPECISEDIEILFRATSFNAYFIKENGKPKKTRISTSIINPEDGFQVIDESTYTVNIKSLDSSDPKKSLRNIIIAKHARLDMKEVDPRVVIDILTVVSDKTLDIERTLKDYNAKIGQQ